MFSGASFVCVALALRIPAQPDRALADVLIFCGIASLGLGALLGELIWVWMLAPLERFERPRDFFRWHDANRLGVMLGLRWAGAFLVFFFTFKSTKGPEMGLLGVSLILYSLMLGFLDAPVLRKLHPARRVE